MPPTTIAAPADPTATFDERLVPLSSPTIGVEPSVQLYKVSFRIHNLRAALIAGWLDPAHQVPFLVQPTAFENIVLRQAPRFPGNGNGPVGLKVPPGVTTVETVDRENTLVATGTKEGLRALSVLLPSLDVPLAQVEIEAQFIQLSGADLAATGLKFTQSTNQLPNHSYAVAMVPAELDFTKLISTGRAKVLSAPRLSAVDGLVSESNSMGFSAIIVDQELLKHQLQAHLEGEANAVDLRADMSNKEIPPGVAYVSSSTAIRFAPLQRKDDLISLVVTPSVEGRSVSVATTVKYEQPFAIQMSPANEEQQIIVVVIARHGLRATG